MFNIKYLCYRDIVGSIGAPFHYGQDIDIGKFKLSRLAAGIQLTPLFHHFHVTSLHLKDGENKIFTLILKLQKKIERIHCD